MKHCLNIFLLLLASTSLLCGQSLEDLYSQENYDELIKHAGSPSLTAEECYFIGYAYFIAEDDKNAIKMYDKAIEKGLDEDYIYLFKGLAYYYSDQYEMARTNYRLAIQRNPEGQKNYTEMGNTFYMQEKYDSALYYFYTARELDFELGDPYLKIPNVYHIQENFEKALVEYYLSAQMIDKSDPDYVEILYNIGLLEYTTTKNYPKSIRAYSEMLSLVPQEYELYAKLIKACYANEEYVKGDSVFNILKFKYEKEELPVDMMESGGETVDQFYWKEQRVSVMKYYELPDEFAEPIYQFFLIDKAGKNVEMKILTEKTMEGMNGTKHLLCGVNKITGAHYTYPVGWKSDDIDYKELKGYVMQILNGEMNPAASSNFVAPSKEKPKKKKKG